MIFFFIQAIVMSLIPGFIFFQLGTDQVSIRDRFSLAFLCASQYPFTITLGAIAAFDFERPQVW